MVKYICKDCGADQYSSATNLEGDPCIKCGSTSTVLETKTKEEYYE